MGRRFRTVLKRLQILQTALLLEDGDLIRSQCVTIKAELAAVDRDTSPYHAVTAIIAALECADYLQAQSRIAALLAQASTLTVREDHERAALKLQLAALEQRCAELNQQHDDMLFRLEDFNRAYSLHLGGIINKIMKLNMLIELRHALRLQEEIDDADDGEDEAQQAEKKAEQAKAQAEYEEAYQRYQEFNQQHQAQLDEPAPAELDEADRKRLKKAFQRASRLCHPDMVDEARKAQATEQFKALNAAYRKNDVEQVEAIFAALQSGGGFATVSEQADDKALLQQQIDALQRRISELEADIAALQDDEAWQLIESLVDEAAYVAYFDEQERLLNAELKRLQAELCDLTG